MTRLRRKLARGDQPEKVPVSGCKVPECEGEHLAKGYCDIHYFRARTWLKHGLPVGDITESRKGFGIIPREVNRCAVEGCVWKSNTRGLCKSHHQRRERGQPLDTPLKSYTRRADPLTAEQQKLFMLGMRSARKAARIVARMRNAPEHLEDLEQQAMLCLIDCIQLGYPEKHFFINIKAALKRHAKKFQSPTGWPSNANDRADRLTYMQAEILSMSDRFDMAA
jgi:hypothetical protein